jgi:hypothetical protein
MIRDPTRLVIDTFHQLMSDKPKHEDVVAAEETNKDLGAIANKSASAMIAELRPVLLNASETAGELSPSRAMCLSALLENLHRLDTNKLWVASEVVAALLENEESQPEEAPKPEPEPDPDEGAPESPQPKANPEDQ